MLASRCICALILASLLFCPALRAIGTAHAQTPSSTKDQPERGEVPKDVSRLEMTQPVACRSIDGFEQFERLPGAVLTSEEKLQVYFRPVNYKVVHEDDLYKIHFSQDGQIRRKGEKPVLRRKKNILDYESKTPHPLGWLFLRNSVPLKGLAPGQYEYDLILRDENNPGISATATLEFRVIPPLQVPRSKAP